MTISEFKKLNNAEQVELFADHASFLARRVGKEAVYMLFDCLGLYMEVKVMMADSLIDSVLIFEQDPVLNLYLQQVNIKDLLKDSNINSA
jgi:hypothetical protein